MPTKKNSNPITVTGEATIEIDGTVHKLTLDESSLTISYPGVYTYPYQTYGTSTSGNLANARAIGTGEAA